MMTGAGGRRRIRGSLAAALAVLAALLAAGAFADPASPLRVGTSLDYAPWSHGADPSSPEGFDAALLRAYAAERGLALTWRRFRWRDLLPQLSADRFDLAASGITVRPERSARGRFSISLAETGALLLARTPERWSGPEAFDRPSVRIGVHAGGHLERVARRRFPHATIVAIPENDAVVRALESERVDAVMTDTSEATGWEARIPQKLARFGPLTRDRKAILLRAQHADLAADLDAWLLAREADGTLARLRAEYLGAAAPRTAEPLAALLAAFDERLSLMPLVGFVKRRDGVPLEVPEREERVIEAALADVREAARRRGQAPPAEPPLRALFRAQLEAAKQVQWSAVRDPDFEPAGPLPDLEGELRPGLLRIGSRISRLLLELPAGLEPAAVRSAASAALRAPYLSAESRDAIADALAGCSPPGDGPRPRSRPQ